MPHDLPSCAWPLAFIQTDFCWFLVLGHSHHLDFQQEQRPCDGTCTHTHAPHMHGILHIIMNNHCRHAVDRVSSAQAIHPHSPYTGMAFKPIRWHTGLKVERSPRT